MANEFKVELGEQAEAIGGFKGAVISRGTVESLVNPEPRRYYEIRSGDKTITVWEPELVFFSE